MYKILISDKLAQEGVDLLNSIDGVEPVVNTGLSEDELCEIIGDYDGLIIRSATQVTPKVLEHAKKLKGVARAGVGVDNIDIPAATKKGVIVMNTPGGNTLSAAEHTMALMLAMSRGVVPACNSLKAGAWDRKKYMGNQLNNKVLGVIGLGRIGMAVVRMALGFNMQVLGYDPFAIPKEAEELGISVTGDLNEIYKKSDFITLHIPRTDQTVNMIDKDQIEMMKPTVRIVNCARGGIINEDALYDALKAEKIAGAALDVFPTEPPKNTRFSDLDNCVVTPHLGASTEEAQIEVAVEAAQILADAIKGGPVKNALNAPSSGGNVSPTVRVYSELAKRIGLMISSLIQSAVKEVEVLYKGELAEIEDLKSVTTAFSIGLLQQHFDMPVNMVNVGVMAKERGINIAETRKSEIKNLSSSFTAKVTTEKGVRSVTGTIYDHSVMRITEIDEFLVEVTPEGPVLIIFNADKPGVIGQVGTLCGKYGININTMGVGQKNGKAVLAVSLDKAVTEDAVVELKKLDFVNELYICKLD